MYTIACSMHDCCMHTNDISKPISSVGPRAYLAVELAITTTYGMLIIIIACTQLICDHFFGQATTNVACTAWPFPPGVLSLSNAHKSSYHTGALWWTIRVGLWPGWGKHFKSHELQSLVAMHTGSPQIKLSLLQTLDQSA